MLDASGSAIVVEEAALKFQTKIMPGSISYINTNLGSVGGPDKCNSVLHRVVHQSITPGTKHDPIATGSSTH